jgi:nucleoside-diphosphate kinase
MVQKTLVILKPDAVERGIVGEILARFERAGLQIIGLKLVKADQKLASDHYHDVDVRYSPEIKKLMVDFMSSNPVVAMVLEGIGAIEKVRLMIGTTYPHQASPGTIRGDYAHVPKDYVNEHDLPLRNLIHASSDPADAERELKLWFQPAEIFDYQRADHRQMRQ